MIIEKGYRAYTGKVFSQSDCDTYNLYCDNVTRLERISKDCKVGSLAWQELEHAKNQRHKMFEYLANN